VFFERANFSKKHFLLLEQDWPAVNYYQGGFNLAKLSLKHILIVLKTSFLAKFG
jgi:hypothetical protein